MNYSVTGQQLTGIADEIRSKTGGTTPITFPNGFVSEINSIKNQLSKTAQQVIYTNAIEYSLAGKAVDKILSLTALTGTLIEITNYSFSSQIANLKLLLYVSVSDNTTSIEAYLYNESSASISIPDNFDITINYNSISLA